MKGRRLLQASVRSLSSRSRPSSSLLAEMRSLLSFSTDSSPSGRPSLNFSFRGVGAIPGVPTSMKYTKLVVEVCCGRRSECLHRKVATAVMESTGQPLQLPRVDFDTQDFQMRTGRTVLNETAIHVAARWGDHPRLLCQLVQKCADELLNVKDYSGRAFLHLLDPKSIEGHARLLFRTLHAKKFRWTLSDLDGNNCLASLVANDKAIQGLDFSSRMDFIDGFNDLMGMLQEKKQSFLSSALFMPTSTGQLTGRRIAIFLERTALWHMERGYTEARSISDLARRYTDVMDDAVDVQDPQGEGSEPLSFHSWLAIRGGSGSPGISRPVSFDDPNTYNTEGETCLMALIRAVADERIGEDAGISWLENLLWRGADLMLTDLRGNTALHHATYWCLPRVVEALVQHGADVRAKNVANETPLDICLKRNSSARSDQTGVEYSKTSRVMVRLFDKSARSKVSARTKRHNSSQNRTRLITILENPLANVDGIAILPI